jgi:hypothetical protein
MQEEDAVTAAYLAVTHASHDPIGVVVPLMKPE